MDNFLEEIRKKQKRRSELSKILFSPFLATKKGLLPSAKLLGDLKNKGKNIILRIEMPDVNKNDICLNIVGNRVEVKAERKQELEVKKRGYYRQDRTYKGFYKAFHLPFEVKSEEVKSTYKNRTLELIIPKKKLLAAKKTHIK